MTIIRDALVAGLEQIATDIINIYLIAPLNWIADNWFLVLIAVLGIRFLNKAIKLAKKGIW